MDLITAKTITRIFWIAINLSCLTIALKDVRVTVPAAVKRGDNANLTCHYDLENDTLYSIKWYKGKREFYRYTPKEDIPMKVFAVTGITVERSMSNASNVMLISMETNSTGKYSCEVSADAPTFHTSIVSGELEVVDLPKIPPRIDIEDKIYSIGNMLLANCTVDNSKPLANLTWLLNNNTLRPHEIIRYNIIGDSTLNSTTSVLGLKLVLQSKHFRYKNLRLACKGTIYNIYENTTEKILELNTTSNQIYTDDFITIGSSRHTQYDGDFNGYGDPYDIRMHHMQASPDRSTSASSCSKCCSSLLLFFLTATTLCSGSSSNNKNSNNSNTESINNTSHNNNNNKNNNNEDSSRCSSKKIDTTDRHTKINNTANINKNSNGSSSDSSCFNIHINGYNKNDENNHSNNDNDDSIQNLILIILLRISTLYSSTMSPSSSLFILQNWSNFYLKEFININATIKNMLKKMKYYIKNNIQVHLRITTMPSLPSSSSLLSLLPSSIFLLSEKSTAEKELSIKLSLSVLFSSSSLLFSILIVIILISRISWSIATSLKYHDVSDLLLVKIQKLNDICGYDIDSCCWYYSYNHNIIYNKNYYCCCYYYHYYFYNCCYSCSKYKIIHIRVKEYYHRQMVVTVLKKYSTIIVMEITTNMTLIMILMIISLISNQMTLLKLVVVIFVAIVRKILFLFYLQLLYFNKNMLKLEKYIR